MSTTLKNRLASLRPGTAAHLLSSSLLSEKSLRRIITLCEILLILLLAQQLAKLTWQFLEPPSKPVVQWKPKLVSEDQAPSVDPYMELEELHLFGQAPIKLARPDAEELDPNAVPKSRLSARVSGIVAGISSTQSIAIINTSGQDRTYRVGETLKGTQAKVKDIYEDRVIVQNRGRHEALYLYPEEANKKVAKRNTPSSELSRRLTEDPTSLGEYFKTTAVSRNGKVIGFRVAPGEKDSFYMESGLKEGDIVIAVDDQKLSETSRTQLIKTIAKLAEVSMTIERDGRLYEIEVQL